MKQHLGRKLTARFHTRNIRVQNGSPATTKHLGMHNQEPSPKLPGSLCPVSSKKRPFYFAFFLEPIDWPDNSVRPLAPGSQRADDRRPGRGGWGSCVLSSLKKVSGLTILGYHWEESNLLGFNSPALASNWSF